MKNFRFIVYVGVKNFIDQRKKLKRTPKICYLPNGAYAVPDQDFVQPHLSLRICIHLTGMIMKKSINFPRDKPNRIVN